MNCYQTRPSLFIYSSRRVVLKVGQPTGDLNSSIGEGGRGEVRGQQNKNIGGWEVKKPHLSVFLKDLNKTMFIKK